MGIAFLVLLKTLAPSEMGSRIVALRRKAGLSQAQLAEALGIPQRTLSFYEREAGDIPAGLAPSMARALGVSADELLGETDKKRRAGAVPTGRMRRLFVSLRRKGVGT